MAIYSPSIHFNLLPKKERAHKLQLPTRRVVTLGPRVGDRNTRPPLGFFVLCFQEIVTVLDFKMLVNASENPNVDIFICLIPNTTFLGYF